MRRWFSSAALSIFPSATLHAACLADLHSLVDCDGNVVKTCPGDQGCSGTECVGACSSANDNKSTVGCDYFVPGPDITFDGAGACFAAFGVAPINTVDVPTVPK